MNDNKKTYPQAVLKNLAREKQEALLFYLDGDLDQPTGKTKGHTIRQSVLWLREDGIATSDRAVSEFRCWFLDRLQFEANQSTAMELVQEAKEQGWQMTADGEQVAGQIFFTRLAIKEKNQKAWFLQQSLNLEKEKVSIARDKIRQNDQRTALMERRVKLLEENAAAAKQKIESALTLSKAKGGLTPETLAEIEQAAKLL